MKQIPLTQGKYALVDDDDFEELNKHKWQCEGDGIKRKFYATNWKAKKKKVPMHHFILNPTKGFEIDHIDGDGLNNQRANLRIVTHSENQFNRKFQRNNTSGYKGVSWHQRLNKWQARINYKGQSIHIGVYEKINDASIAYEKKSKELFGKFKYEVKNGC